MIESASAGSETPRVLELESARELERIPGVLAAAVWLGQRPHVREVYIAAAPGAELDKIRSSAGDVLQRHGLVCPPDAIQLAVIDERAPPAPQQAEEQAAELPPWYGRFLVLADLDMRRAGNTATCRVRLQRLGDSFDGEARELDTPAGRGRAAARATLAAAQQAAEGIELALEGLVIVDLFGRSYVILSVEAASARRVAHLSGIAAVERSTEDAACLATLDAVERWIAW